MSCIMSELRSIPKTYGSPGSSAAQVLGYVAAACCKHACGLACNLIPWQYMHITLLHTVIALLAVVMHKRSSRM